MMYNLAIWNANVDAMNERATREEGCWMDEGCDSAAVRGRQHGKPIGFSRKSSLPS